MTRARFEIPRPDGAVLAGERRTGTGGPTVLLLHAGVADRRSWTETLDLLEGERLDLVAYDRRGYGETPRATDPFRHLDDAIGVLDAIGADRAVIVGNSMGGALALDLALTAPDRVASVLLMGSAVSGMTDEGEAISWTADEATGAILSALEQAERDGDVEEQVWLELHLWLDGPSSLEGRVGGARRALAAEMNRRILTAGTTGGDGDAGLDTWHRLAEVTAPVLATWGALDLPPDAPFFALTAERLADADARVLPGVAHLPSMERPDLVADLIREAVARA